MNSFRKVVVVAAALLLSFAFAVPVSADYDENYTYYDSLTATGSDYINTGVAPSSSSRVVIDFNFNGLDAAYRLFGSTSSGSNDGLYAYSLVINGGSVYLIAGSTSTNISASYDSDGVNTLDIDIPNSSLNFNGVSYSISVPSFSNPNPMYLFAVNEGNSPSGYSKATIYSCRIYDSGTLVRSFIPSADSEGRGGMWDEVNNVFYGNNGTGSFVLGDEFIPTPEGPTVAEQIDAYNTQIEVLESAIYDDLHTWSAQVDPSSATNFSGDFISAMSFISDTWTAAYDQLGDMQVIVTFPLFLAIAMLFIGRMNSVVASGAMKSRKNNDKQGGGNVG